MIMISALVCNSQPMAQVSVRRQPKIWPAICTPTSLPTTAATSKTPAATKTIGPPISQLVRSPVDRK